MISAGKVAIITGASSGIGAATAALFAKQGTRLVLAGRNEAGLQKTAASCGKDCDVTSESYNKTLVERAIAEFGQLDILVNNAGILETGSIEATSLDQFDRVMTTNVRSIYSLTMEAVSHLIASKGCIVNVSSVTGIRSFPGLLAYNVSKSAVDQFTRCVALELADRGVRVNGVNPGVIVTELQKRGGMDDSAYKDFLERCKQSHALGRPGDVDEVASAIAFLASDKQSSFITGISLPVDGGRHVMCPR